MHVASIAMKITALSALLLAATTSFVSAAPNTAETTGRVSYTEKGERAKPAARDAWIELASPTPASHGREYIAVDSDLGEIVRLRVDAHTGRPIVRTVRIDYADGKQRVVRIDKVLDHKHPVYVDLGAPRRIERIVVVSEGPSKATYTVEGALARTEVAAR